MGYKSPITRVSHDRDELLQTVSYFYSLSIYTNEVTTNVPVTPAPHGNVV